MNKPCLRVCMAQINTSVGDFPGNLNKIKAVLAEAYQNKADLVIFPEMTLTGYPPEDLLFKNTFIQKNLSALKEILPYTKKLMVVLGFVDKTQGGLYNSAAFIKNGKLAGVYHKNELPNYGVFDEKRYFKKGSTPCFVSIAGHKAALSICEDIWPESAFVYSKTFKKGNASILINISASPYHAQKQKERRKLIERLAKKTGTWVFYLNLVGGQDELLFDGGSLVASPAGHIISESALLAEDVRFLELSLSNNRQSKISRKESENKKLTLEAEVYKALVLGTKDYVQKNRFEKVLIGLSGGIDSALVARIAVDALGASNVVGVTMPSPYTSKETLADAIRLAENLGIKCRSLNISPVFKSYLKSLQPVFKKTPVNITEENLQARIRGNFLMALSNKFGFLVLTTGNKSEMATGYCTLYGDMAGGFAVLKDVPKTLVFRLSAYRNKLAPLNSIPESILKRPPTAELKHGQKDQDTLPPYSQLDQIIEAYVENDKGRDEIKIKGVTDSVLQKALRLIDTSEYKRRQSPPGIKITPKAFGRDRRMPITNRFCQ